MGEFVGMASEIVKIYAAIVENPMYRISTINGPICWDKCLLRVVSQRRDAVFAKIGNQLRYKDNYVLFVPRYDNHPNSLDLCLINKFWVIMTSWFWRNGGEKYRKEPESPVAEHLKSGPALDMDIRLWTEGPSIEIEIIFFSAGMKKTELKWIFWRRFLYVSLFSNKVFMQSPTI